MFKIIPPISVAAIVLGVVAGSGCALAADDFPFIGNYTQNVLCKGDGSDPPAVQAFDIEIRPMEHSETPQWPAGN